MASISTIFPSTYYTKQLNPWANLSASSVVNYSWLSACQGEREPLKITRSLMYAWPASETIHGKSSLGKLQYQYLPELLVNVYCYFLIEKSVSFYCVCVCVCVCVCGRQTFSKLVTNSNVLLPPKVEIKSPLIQLSLLKVLPVVCMKYTTQCESQ